MKRHPAPPFLARQVLGLLAPIVFTGPAFANKALAEKHGYLGCHAAATKLVGPALREIAARYAGDANAAAALVQSIRNGVTGKWGETPMPTKKQVNEAEAKKLTRCILEGAK